MMNEHLRTAAEHQRLMKFISLFDPRWDSLLVPHNEKPFMLKRLFTGEYLQLVARHLRGADDAHRIGFRLKRDSDGHNCDEADGYTRAGCVDIDSHGVGGKVADGMLVRDAFVNRGFDVYMELSKSGRGWHIWAFFEERVPVTDWRATAAIVIAEAGAPKLEIFPTAGDYGAAPWTPYFNFRMAEATGRTAFLDPFASFRPIPLAWILDHAVANPANLLINGYRPEATTPPARPKMRSGVWRRGAGRRGPSRLPRVVEHGDATRPARNTADGACRAAGMILKAGGAWDNFVAWNETYSTPPMDTRELKSVWDSISKRYQQQHGGSGVQR